MISLSYAPFIATRETPRLILWRQRRRTAPVPCVRVAATPQTTPYKVSGMGSAGLDYLALVSAFPNPDDKIRTESFEVQGGGNCGNALTGAAKLGLKPFILTKVGDDSIGNQTLDQLNSEGIDTSCVVVAEGSPSGFTYIIVDRQGATRTCIHTPAAPLDWSEIDMGTLDRFLADAQLVYFDGRLTEAAIPIAKEARERQITVLVEAERLRPNLEQLIDLGDIIVTSKHFPTDFSGESCLGDALHAMINRFQNAKLMITTLGDKGSVAVEVTQQPDGERQISSACLEDQLEECRSVLDSMRQPDSDPTCISKNSTSIWTGLTTTSTEFYPTLKRSPEIHDSVERTARENAKLAAAANANPTAYVDYVMSKQQSMNSTVQLTVATAAQIAKEAIVDTTGAGDAFIASVLYGVVHKLPLDEMLAMSGIVAACKCTEIGARAGQPTLNNMKLPQRNSVTLS